MTEALITDLARLAGLKRVIARSSVMRYKGTDKTLLRIARELNVDALVTGAVLRSGNRVRVTVQLIHPITGEQLWADRYERDLRDILTLQNDILSSIASQIKVKLTRQDAARLASVRPVTPEAYELCLKGRFHAEKLSRDSFDVALEHYRLALEKEPDYALAHAGIGGVLLARAHMGLVSAGGGDGRRQVGHLEGDRARRHNLRGARSTGEQRLLPGMELERDRSRALQRALEFNPNLIGGTSWAELLLLNGRRAEAAGALDWCLELDPLNPWTQTSIGGRYLGIDRDEEGIALLKRALRADPNLALAHQYLATAFHKRGAYAQVVCESRAFLTLKGHEEAADALENGCGTAGYQGGMRLAADALATCATIRYVQPTWVAAFTRSPTMTRTRSTAPARLRRAR